MTPTQIQLVQSTLPRLVASKEEVARLFYSRLFELDPVLRTLFKGQIADQGEKLMAMLGTLIAGLDRPKEIVPILHALSRRHAAYGVQDRDYATVGTALLWTLERCLGPAFTAEMRDGWIATYFVISRTMIEAARSGVPIRMAS
jgi:hemoglobin-like flavoprotein